MSGNEPARLYQDSLSTRNKLERAVWRVAYLLLLSWTPRPFFGPWRLFVLRAFGAKIGSGCKVYQNVRIWLPRNLAMGHRSCIGEGTDCYNVAPITLGNYVTVSQRSFLCSAGHDQSRINLPLTWAPITLENHSWICAETYVGPGVTAREGSVLAARGAATKDLEAWTVYGGVPAKRISERKLADGEVPL